MQVLVCALQMVVDGVCVAAGARSTAQQGQKGDAWGFLLLPLWVHCFGWHCGLLLLST